ncbi:MAG: hypothetical protein KF734_21965 [Saprospiraceae bacterium]|nr:hypothetical protein [Saprospiraceae bacterium]
MSQITPDEIKRLEARRNLLAEKVGRLRDARILATDENEKFKYDHNIAEAELELTDVKKQLADAYDLGTESGQSFLREKVLDLSLTGEMGRLHLVNCDRLDLRDRFEAGFDHRQNTLKAPNHYYFLSSCPSQMPPSLGERMVYELLGELLDDGKNPVFCRYNARNHDRVDLKKLPIGITLEKSQELFRKFLAAHFDWPIHTDLPHALAQNLFPKPNYAFSILPFSLRKAEWRDFFPEYFDWIAQQLAQRPPGGPTLLLFFVVYLDDLHRHYDPATQTCSDEKSAAILTALDALVERHPAAGHFYPLLPVPETDLRDWFFDLGETNTARLRPVLDTLANALPPDERELYRQKLLNMNRVELVQEIVFEAYNKEKL